MKNEDIFDVIVVGAGPSGSTAAYHINNLKVLIVDKYKFPRFKAGSGIIDHNRLLNTFENYRIIEKELNKYEANSIHFYYDTNFGFKRTYDYPYTHVDRYELDYSLLRVALTKDNVTFRKFNVEEIFQKDDHFVLSDKKSHIKTRFIIGADGCNSIVSRSLGNKWRKVGEYCVAIEYIIDCKKKSRSNHMLFLFNKEIGYAWVLPVQHGYYVGLGLVGSTRKPIKEYLNDLLHFSLNNNLIPKNYIIRKTTGTMVPVKIADIYASDKIILCGDALGSVRQVTGAGIYFGMLSGKIAGETISSSIENIGKRYKKGIKPVLKKVTFFKNIPSRFVVNMLVTIPFSLLLAKKLPKKIRETYQDWFLEKFLEIKPM